MRAPWARCHSCRGERRTGRKCSPIWRPANAPIDTGVKGGRKVVVPTWEIATLLKPAEHTKPEAKSDAQEKAKSGEVVTLDAFRKK